MIDVDSDYQTDETYTYDANGNRTIAGYTTGDNNRLLSDGTHNYTYDAEGNRTKKTDISTGDYVEYTWDHRNRLTSVTFRTSGGVKTKEVQYTYDVFDRRIAKDVDDDGDSTIDRGERYVYDGTDVALVYDESDNLVERLLYGPGVDQPLASEDGSGDVLWFLADNQGTVRDVAEYDDVSGDTTVVNHIQYGGFGNITAQSNSTYEPRHTYTGREWDADSELFYYRARWYDPLVGRFISEDPIGFGAGDANLSRYVGNSTPNYVDPSGLESYWQGVGNVFKAYGNALAGAASDGYTMARHPIATAQGIGQGFRNLGNAAKNTANVYNDVRMGVASGDIGRALADRAVGISENLGDGSFDGGVNDWGWFGVSLVNDFTGANRLIEAYHGVDLATGEQLSSDDRLLRGFIGLLETGLTLLGIKAGASKAGNACKAAPKGAATTLDTIPEGRRLAPYYPQNRGFLGDAVDETLQPGVRIDRYGFEGGTFASPQGVPAPMRALPPGSLDKPYNVYEVVKPLDVKSGTAAPWFQQPGLGTQYELPQSIGDLIEQGIIRRVE